MPRFASLLSFKRCMWHPPPRPKLRARKQASRGSPPPGLPRESRDQGALRRSALRGVSETFASSFLSRRGSGAEALTRAGRSCARWAVMSIADPMPIQRFAGSGDPFSCPFHASRGGAPKLLNAMRAWALALFWCDLHETQKAIVSPSLLASAFCCFWCAA